MFSRVTSFYISQWKPLPTNLSKILTSSCLRISSNLNLSRIPCRTIGIADKITKLAILASPNLIISFRHPPSYSMGSWLETTTPSILINHHSSEGVGVGVGVGVSWGRTSWWRGSGLYVQYNAHNTGG